MKTVKHLIILVASCFGGHVAVAQLNNTLISDRIALNASDSNRWGITVSNFNYMRNTEYFNDIEAGRTLFGYQLNPSLFIQPNEHVKLQAGVFLRSDFGGDPVYTQILPTFSLKLRYNHTSFIFGTLEGALAHRLYEPLYDINSAIERRIENGFQFKHESDRNFFDLWINWEQFIERGSPYKEQFTAGVNYTPVMVSNESGFKLSVPLQGTAFHRGGQIDADTSNMVMVFNGAVGLEAKQEFTAGFLRMLKADAVSLYYTENTNSGYMPFRTGQGLMTNLYAESRMGLGLMLSYWQGYQYISPRGTTLYQSVSIDNPSHTEATRQLIFVRFLYQTTLSKNLHLSARVEPVYDVKASLLDYSYSLYISYTLQQGFGRLTH